jgi:putative Ig domain-containing protein
MKRLAREGAGPLLLAAMLTLPGCGGGGGGGQATPPPNASSPTPTPAPTPTPTPTPTPLVATATPPAAGQVGKTFSATPTATGGTPPLTWSVASGTLPAGLSLGTSTGEITGTPTDTADHAALTLQVTDSGTPAQTASLSLTFIVSPSDITVAASPQRAALTAGSPLTFTASTNDYAGLNWSISPTGGTFSKATSNDGEAITLTAPATGNSYTVTATSVADPTRSSSVTIGVTDLAGMFTYHNSLARDGANTSEYALSPATVTTATFGKLASCVVDGAIYTQPLWMANVKIGSVTRNVVFVATAHDSLFAFDADATPCQKLWSANLIDAAHGATANEVTVPNGRTGFYVGKGDGNFTPEVGITGTPVIDPASGTLYVVSKSMTTAGPTFYQRLHAIDVTTGSEKTGSPVTIAGTAAGTADGGATVAFNSRTENQRTGLVLMNGTVYVAWAAHEDAPPYHGWMMAYRFDGKSFTQTAVLNVSPKARQAGIWMSGAAPAADANNMLYVTTGNGTFDVTTSPHDYGDSFLQLSPSLVVQQYFTPTNEQTLNSTDKDFGAGGAAVIGDLPAGSPIARIAITGGKDGALYVIDRDKLGGLGDANAWQKIQVGATQGTARPPGIFAIGALWNNTLYIAGTGGPLEQYKLDTTTVKLSLFSWSTSPTAGYPFPGSNPSISSAGAQNGIVWMLDNTSYCTSLTGTCGPTVLHAYDASDVKRELWNSSIVAADAAGNAVKFAVPTVANGRVYVGTRGNNSGGVLGSTSAAGELSIYGLKPN